MNNQHDSEMERRLLFAILLSMAVLFTTPYIYELLYPPNQELVRVPASVQNSPPVETQSRSRPVGSEVQPEVEATAEEISGRLTEGRDQVVTVENMDLRVQFHTRGAVIERVELRRYGDGNGGLELLPQGLPIDFAKLLAIELEDEFLTSALQQGIFELDGAPAGIVRAPTTLQFKYQDPSVYAEKTIEVPAEGYALRVKTRVVRTGVEVAHSVVLGTGIGSLKPQDEGDFRFPGIAYDLGDSVTRYDEGDLTEGSQMLEMAARWVALDSKYFTYALAPSGGVRALQMRRVAWQRPLDDATGQTVETPLLVAAVKVGPNHTGTLFLGPKDRGALAAADPALLGVINYGWFAFLVKPLLLGLTFIFQYIHNYGWAIIVLTFLINLALFPLRYKQMASMKKMSALQPQLKSIQDRYKRMKRDDPRRQQMNTEVMALYREHGVNPLGGCLPLLVQMPILFAFYRMLDAAIELRGAPFVLWIQDLSKPDPYYVTPIVMGITMVAQQKMTPATGDPTQRRMMMFLPAVFTLFFLGVSSGLALYFLFSNVFAMMLQFLLQRVKSEPSPSPKKGKSGRKKTGNRDD